MLGNTDHIMPGSAQLDHHGARAKEVGEGVRVAVSFSRETERDEGKERSRVGGGLDWRVRGERQPIRLGDDSPMVGIYSNRREGGMWGRRREGANSLGGGQDNVTAPSTGSGERQRPQR